MTAAIEAPAGILLGRCNPYGHSTGRGGDAGPRHLGGGLWPAAYEGAKKWRCENYADGRYVMTCVHGHTSANPMSLCYPHVAMIARRQSGICPPCVMPPAARTLYEQVMAAQARVAWLIRGAAGPAAVAAAAARAEDLAAAMTDLVARGIAHRCPLTLTEVS